MYPRGAALLVIGNAIQTYLFNNCIHSSAKNHSWVVFNPVLTLYSPAKSRPTLWFVRLAHAWIDTHSDHAHQQSFATHTFACARWKTRICGTCLSVKNDLSWNVIFRVFFSSSLLVFLVSLDLHQAGDNVSHFNRDHLRPEVLGL